MPHATDTLPLSEASRGKTLSGLLGYIATRETNPPTEWTRQDTFRENIGTSQTSFTKHQTTAVKFGLLERSGEETAASRRYRIPDTPVTGFLQRFHREYSPATDPAAAVRDVSLGALLEDTTRTQLVIWFLTEATPETAYSKADLVAHTELSRTGVNTHLGMVRRRGIVDKLTRYRGSQEYGAYQLNSTSSVGRALWELNNRLADYADNTVETDTCPQKASPASRLLTENSW